jgi:hypothetical protein
MKSKSVDPFIFTIAIILFTLISISIPVFGQGKYSVSGEITYWWKEGQIILWLITKEERHIDKSLVPIARTLTIELDSQDTQEIQNKKVEAETVNFKFIGVPEGTYGIFCILDMNKNGKLDYPEGFEPGTIPPIEPYAYSGPKSWGRAPFDDFKFNVGKDISGLKIQLK